MPGSNFALSSFYGKILLFGEYTVLLKGNALAIPLQNSVYSGVLKQDDSVHSNPMWKKWLEYLLKRKDSHFREIEFDWIKFQNDINQGLTFDSNIPVGYGLGSSGALTAAVFRRYIHENQWPALRDNLTKLQQTLANFESFFHSSSSGLDPLISILNAPIQITNEETLLLPGLSRESCTHWFLIDSGLPRQTGLLVESFRRKLESEKNFENTMEELKDKNNQLIEHFLTQNEDHVKDGMRQISQIQFSYLDWLIPQNLQPFWAMGLETNRFHLKLCGAGGGGFFLAYVPETEDQDYLNERLGIFSLATPVNSTK